MSVDAEWSKDHVSAIGAYTLIFWILMLDKMETGRGHLGGSVKYSEGKDEESDVPIPRFLCGNPTCVG
jgi:hypothetical protein